MKVFWRSRLLHNLLSKGFWVNRILGAITAFVVLLWALPSQAAAVEPMPPIAPGQLPVVPVATTGHANRDGNYIDLPTGTDHVVFLPFISSVGCNGIYGFVSDHGTRAPGISLDLRFYNGSSWSTRMTRPTDAYGQFCFGGLTTLQDGQAYYVRYGPQATDSSCLTSWSTRHVTSYSVGEKVNIGDFDLADIGLVSPGPGASVTLPQPFTWTRRAGSTSDSYEFNLYNPAHPSLYYYTAPLGYTNTYTPSTLPAGFNTGISYGWYIAAYSPDGSYGVSFYYHPITFLNRGAGSSPTGISVDRVLQDRFQSPAVPDR